MSHLLLRISESPGDGGCCSQPCALCAGPQAVPLEDAVDDGRIVGDCDDFAGKFVVPGDDVGDVGLAGAWVGLGDHSDGVVRELA